jgi:hypothetical protein
MVRLTFSYDFGQEHKLDGGAVEHEPCLKIKEGPPRRLGATTTMQRKFPSSRLPVGSAIPTAYNRYTIIGIFIMHYVFELPKVKVPVFRPITAGVPRHWGDVTVISAILAVRFKPAFPHKL